MTVYGCEFTLDHLVFCIGMLLLGLEGAYFTLTSLVEVQMTTLTPHLPPTPPASDRTILGGHVSMCVPSSKTGDRDVVERCGQFFPEQVSDSDEDEPVRRQPL